MYNRKKQCTGGMKVQNLKSVSLELSLKPFKKLDPEYIESVCRKVFHQWQGLTAEAKVIKILIRIYLFIYIIYFL